MWRYEISTGTLTDPSGAFAGTGYSGLAGRWRNNPSEVAAVAMGPIPPGLWHIGPAHLSPHTGPITMDLDPKQGTHTLGRSAFRINHDASHGCVILGPAIRRQIEASEDRTLEVVP